MTRILAGARLAAIGGLQASPPTADAVTKQLLGNWKLVKYQVFDESWIGSDQVRYYGFSADRDELTLSLKSGDRVTQTLTWNRVT